MGITDYIFEAINPSSGAAGNGSSSTPPKPDIKASPLNHAQVGRLVETMQAGRVARKAAETDFHTAHKEWAELRGAVGGPMVSLGLIGGMYATMLHHAPVVAAGAVFGSIMLAGATIKSYNLYQNVKHAGQANLIKQDNQVYDRKEAQAQRRLAQLERNPDAAPMILEAQKTSLADGYQRLHDTVYGPAAAKDERGGKILNGAGMIGLAIGGTIALASSELHFWGNAFDYAAAETIAFLGLKSSDEGKNRQERRTKATTEFYEAQQGLSSNFDKKVSPDQARQVAFPPAGENDGFMGGLRKMGKMFGI